VRQVGWLKVPQSFAWDDSSPIERGAMLRKLSDCGQGPLLSRPASLLLLIDGHRWHDLTNKISSWTMSTRREKQGNGMSGSCFAFSALPGCRSGDLLDFWAVRKLLSSQTTAGHGRRSRQRRACESSTAAACPVKEVGSLWQLQYIEDSHTVMLPGLAEPSRQRSRALEAERSMVSAERANRLI
jgi:hypothetical protein